MTPTAVVFTDVWVRYVDGAGMLQFELRSERPDQYAEADINDLFYAVVDVDEVTTLLKTQLIQQEGALQAARLLCANLARGGQGHMTLVNAFHEKDI